MKTETLLELIDNREYIIKRITMRHDRLRIVLRRGASNLIIEKMMAAGYCNISLNTYQTFKQSDNAKIAKKLKPLIQDAIKIEF